MSVPWLGMGALALGGAAAAFIVWFLIRSPKLSWAIKVQLFFAMFVLPTTSAVLGNVSNLETTKTVKFCGQCHVMTSYVRDAYDPKSRSLASGHARLPEYKDDACYGCHADYGMFGGVTTKIGGMRHVWEFYTGDWTRPGHEAPALYEPFDTRTCMSCHDPLRAGAPIEHQLHAQKIESRAVKCTADGCHGRPHPVWKPEVVRP